MDDETTAAAVEMIEGIARVTRAAMRKASLASRSGDSPQVIKCEVFDAMDPCMESYGVDPAIGNAIEGLVGGILDEFLALSRPVEGGGPWPT